MEDLKVKDAGLVKRKNALISIDNQGLKAYRARRKKKREYESKLSELEGRIKRLEELLGKKE